jgi:hypothetical protein
MSVVQEGTSVTGTCMDVDCRKSENTVLKPRAEVKVDSLIQKTVHS